MRLFIVVFIMLFYTSFANAQGCSDAGACTAGSLKQHSDSDSGKHKISFISVNGLGDDQVFVSAYALQYDFRVRQSILLQAKINGNYATGHLGSVTGAGDLLIDATKIFTFRNKWNLSGTTGLKLPLNDGNLYTNGLSLPMQYQSSLGTYDLILGLTLSHKNLMLSAGYPQPLTKSNENKYEAHLWNNKYAWNYPPSHNLKRAADVLFKAGYNFHINDHWTINPGLLMVYHVRQDRFFNTLGYGELLIKGSEGLTINATAGIWYNYKKITLGIVSGKPIIVREIRPDGLTRSITIAPEIAYQF